MTDLVTVKEIVLAPDPTERQIWSVCHYALKSDDLKECKRCPTGEMVDGLKATRACRLLAEEACRVVFAAGKETG